MDFRYLVETKNEFNNFLCGILVPHIFHGIKGMYKYSENVFEQIEKKNKKGAKINNPGVIQIFKKTLDGIKEINNHEIEQEYQRIKIKSGCVDFFDNLIRAVFKSYVLFLTWDPKIEESKYTDNSIYKQISIKDYIHKCYIISCEYFRENPELFLGSKSNKKDIFEIIKNCIELAIKKSLPYNQIIEEYMQIEFTKKDNRINREIADVKNMVYDMINNRKYGENPTVGNIILDESDNYINVDNKLGNNKFGRKEEVENFIKNEIEKENNKRSVLETSSNQKYNEQNNSEEFVSTSGLPTSPMTNKSQYSKTSLTKNDASNQDSSNLLQTGGETGLESGLESGANSGETSAAITRSSLKSKELDELIEDNNSDEQESSRELSETSQDNISTKSKSLENITSPPAIRMKPADRLIEIEREAVKNDKTTDKKTTDKKKSDIKVIMKKKNKLSNKFNELEEYYGKIVN